MLATFSMMFSRTLDRRKQPAKEGENAHFCVRKLNNELIRDRNCKSERILCLLNPELSDMTYRPIRNMIDDAVQWLEDNSSDVLDLAEKKDFLFGLKEILTEYCKEEDHKGNAIKDFAEIVKAQADEQLSAYIDGVVTIKFGKCMNDDVANHYIDGKDGKECFSKVMTNRECIKFWSEDDSIKPDAFGPSNSPATKTIKMTICRVLGLVFKLIDSQKGTIKSY